MNMSSSALVKSFPGLSLKCLLVYSLDLTLRGTDIAAFVLLEWLVMDLHLCSAMAALSLFTEVKCT